MTKKKKAEKPRDGWRGRCRNAFVGRSTSRGKYEHKGKKKRAPEFCSIRGEDKKVKNRTQKKTEGDYKTEKTF